MSCAARLSSDEFVVPASGSTTRSVLAISERRWSGARCAYFSVMLTFAWPGIFDRASRLISSLAWTTSKCAQAILQFLTEQLIGSVPDINECLRQCPENGPCTVGADTTPQRARVFRVRAAAGEGGDRAARGRRLTVRRRTGRRAVIVRRVDD